MSYALGITYPPTAIDELLGATALTGSRRPQDEYKQRQYVDRLDGQRAALGWPGTLWRFDVLTAAMANALAQLCPGGSAAVYVTTRGEDGQFQEFTGVMVWPQEVAARRQSTRLVGLEIEFRRLDPIYNFNLTMPGNSQYVALLEGLCLL